MPQVSLQRPRVDAIIRKLIAAGVAKHVRVRLDLGMFIGRGPRRAIDAEAVAMMKSHVAWTGKYSTARG